MKKLIWLIVVLAIIISGAYLLTRNKTESPSEVAMTTGVQLPSSFISPKGLEQWKIGEDNTIEITKPIEDFYPFTHLTLNKPNGEKVGIIACKIGGGGSDGRTSFDWGTKTVLNYCGAGLNGRIVEISPGTYMVAITEDIEGSPVM